MSVDRSALALQLALIMGSLITVIVICGTILIAMAIRKSTSDDDRILTTFFEHGTLLQILTSAAIVISAVLLRVLDLINSEAAVSLLSGLAGYVLAGLSRGPLPTANSGAD
jgi:heme/copper-type cytochrome/quinol oxidase subunit 2